MPSAIIFELAVSLVFPDTATGDFLDLSCSAFGLDREPATYSVRKVVCTDSAGEPMAVPVGAASAWGG